MMAQKTVYLSQRRKANCKSNLTSPFTSTSGGSIRCFISPCSPPPHALLFHPFPVHHSDTSVFHVWINVVPPLLNCISLYCLSYQYFMSVPSLLSIALHLVGMVLCLTSHAVSQGMMLRAISLCLRMLSRESSAPKWRTVRDETDCLSSRVYISAVLGSK